MTGEFLAAQADEWIARFYGFLATDSALVRAARTAPVIRLEDGRQVVPVDGEDRPAGVPARAGRQPACPPCGGPWRPCRPPGRSWPR